MKKTILLSAILIACISLHAQWNELCTGVAGNNGFVVDFAYFEDTLYATGLFTELCDVAADHAVKWDGSNWTAVNIPHDGHAMEVIDEVLHFATYQFANDSNYVWRYDGATVSALGEGVFNEGGGTLYTPNIYDIIEYDGQIIASGDFNRVGDKDIMGIMKWTGTEWDSLGGGLTGNLPGAPPITYPHKLLVDGSDLWICGNFSHAGGNEVNGIAGWDGANWFGAGPGFDQAVYGIAVYDGTLWAGGQFTQSGVDDLGYIARWNGSAWESPGFGFGSADAFDFTFVHTLTLIDDKLLIAGGFDQVILEDGTIIPCGSVIAWDGDSIYTFDGGAGEKEIEAVIQTTDGYLFGGGLYEQGYIAEWTEETPLSVTDHDTGVKLYPNPASDRLYVETNDFKQAAYRIMDLSGKLVQSGLWSGSFIQVASLPAGMYLLELQTETGNHIRAVFFR